MIITESMLKMVVDMLLKQLPPDTGPIIDKLIRDIAKDIETFKGQQIEILDNQATIIAQLQELKNDRDSSGSAPKRVRSRADHGPSS